MGQTESEITVYSDYVCPFCYLGRRSLDQYQEAREDDLSVNWQPFDLRSQKRGPNGEVNHSVDDGKDEEYFDEVRENVARLKEQYDAGEMLDFDEIPDEVDSYNAQVASLYVDREHPESWPAFDEAVFTALWVEGRDIGDPAVLAALAEDAGLDGDEIRSAVEDEELATELETKFQAAQRERITGVPTFVYGEHAARGAVPPEHLRRLVEGG